jgi:hypothetical protein
MGMVIGQRRRSGRAKPPATIGSFLCHQDFDRPQRPARHENLFVKLSVISASRLRIIAILVLFILIANEFSAAAGEAWASSAMETTVKMAIRSESR